ncbi:exostosin family protein [Variovorax sp. dw_954]|uniref:exostosin domain-containing protein n=1 Tax=Variovorax sp. dw_954 TaxID=2720078 RepID=UPI001BD24F3E|nr:exostosin family protein [Variovorax sp. dw_954]
MLKVHVSTPGPDATFGDKLKAVLGQFDNFVLTSDPAAAEVILMPENDSRIFASAPVFQSHKEKCVAISDGDILSYYMPSLYASNHRSLLSRGRALTAGPFSSLVEAPLGSRNAWISPLKDAQVEKRYLYSFMGGSTSMLRKRLFRYYRSLTIADALVESTDHYKHWSRDASPEHSAQQRRYIETMQASKFVLCPRGASASSIRLFESMELGCAPIVLADRWIPVDGVDWSFCLFVKESRYRELDVIVRSHADEWQERGAAARKAFNGHFSHSAFGATMERQLRDLVRHRDDGRERLIRAVYPLYRGATELKGELRLAARNTVLAGFRMLGVKFPYDLNK